MLRSVIFVFFQAMAPCTALQDGWKSGNAVGITCPYQGKQIKVSSKQSPKQSQCWLQIISLIKGSAEVQKAEFGHGIPESLRVEETSKVIEPNLFQHPLNHSTKGHSCWILGPFQGWCQFQFLTTPSQHPGGAALCGKHGKSLTWPLEEESSSYPSLCSIKCCTFNDFPFSCSGYVSVEISSQDLSFDKSPITSWSGPFP